MDHLQPVVIGDFVPSFLVHDLTDKNRVESAVAVAEYVNHTISQFLELRKLVNVAYRGRKW